MATRKEITKNNDTKSTPPRNKLLIFLSKPSIQAEGACATILALSLGVAMAWRLLH